MMRMGRRQSVALQLRRSRSPCNNSQPVWSRHLFLLSLLSCFQAKHGSTSPNLQHYPRASLPRVPRSIRASHSNHSILDTMSTSTRFFAYGTLRDDDDSGAVWTSEWTAGVSRVWHAKIRGFKMYKSKRANWPFALRTGRADDFMVGRLLQWDEPDTFYRKVQHADRIEDYDAMHPEGADDGFLRDVVEVELMQAQAQTQELVTAIIYFQRTPASALFGCDAIPNGDWMERHLLDTSRSGQEKKVVIMILSYHSD